MLKSIIFSLQKFTTLIAATDHCIKDHPEDTLLPLLCSSCSMLWWM